MSTSRNRALGWAAVGLLTATWLTGCGLLTGPTATTGLVIDGIAVGPQLVLTGDQFHRLEATARDAWTAAHPGEALSGFEVHGMPGRADATATDAGGRLEFLVLVRVAGGAQHELDLHCDPATFPAPDSCS